jgi:hypothetical protein
LIAATDSSLTIPPKVVTVEIAVPIKPPLTVPPKVVTVEIAVPIVPATKDPSVVEVTIA